MKTITVCGKRGLGDIVEGLSFVIGCIKEDTHIVFCYPGTTAYNYYSMLSDLMDLFELPEGIKITYEVRDTGYFIHYRDAKNYYGADGFEKDWFFTGVGGYRIVTKFKQQWQGNKNGPIAIYPNYKEFVESPHTHPHPEKFFSKKVNNFLLSIVDDKSYKTIGIEKTLKGSVDIMVQSRYVIGFEGAYTHISFLMGVPYVCVRNNRSEKIIRNFHPKHDRMKIIDVEDLYQYIV